MSALDDKVYDFLFPCVGLPEGKFIHALEDITRRKLPYADFQLIRNGVVGTSVMDVDADGYQEINQDKVLEVQVNFYGDTSEQLAEDFLLRLEMELSLLRGEQLNFGLQSTTAPIDTSSEINKTWERRYTVRVTLSHTAAVLDNVGLIEHVIMNGSFS